MNKKLLKISLLSFGVIFMSAKAACDTSRSCDSLRGECDRGDVSGHTFLSIRPQFQSGMPEKESLWRRRATPGPCGLGRECGIGGAVQAVVFGGRSTKSCRLGQFFSPTESNVLTVNSDQSAGADINPTNFGVAFGGTFSSTISLNPRQSVVGVGLEWRQYLGWWNDCGSNWWFDVSLPIVRVRNKVNLVETAPVTTGDLLPGAAATMTAAFAGLANFNAFDTDCAASAMQFGLIPLDSNCGITGTGLSCCNSSKLKKTRIADVELKIGVDALCTDCAYANGYVGVLIPAGNRPKGVNMFEPIVGHNRHVGFLFGSLFAYDIWSNCDQNLSWEINMDSRYLFKRTETRSFDLRNRPWSRYLLVYATPDDAVSGCATPGINVFTRDMKVTPRFQTSINTALVYNQMCGFSAEVGYNFWARQSEKVCLKEPFPTGIAIAALDAANGLVPLSTNVLSNIGFNNSAFCTIEGEDCEGCECILTSQAQVLAVGNTLDIRDIDLSSAINPAVVSNIIYGTVGYDFDWCVPMFVGVGGSYEFSSINTAVNRWNVWGKFGVSF